MDIKTILCPIDFSSLSDYELRLAAEVCEAFDAHLVLHHNLAAIGPGFAKAWEWQEAHQPVVTSRVTPDGSAAAAEDADEEVRARQRLAEILARLPKSVSAEARISRGPVGLVLFYLIEEIGADLVVLGSHGWSSEQHASLTERLIDGAPCPVLTFQEGRGEHSFHLCSSADAGSPRVLVPIDFSESAAATVAYASELARATPCELHLLHVQGRKLPAEPVDHTGTVTAVAAGDGATAERRLWEMVPGDLASRADCHVAEGAICDQILAAARKLDVELIVMGEHARGFLRHFFTHDTAREMLHRAPCPVWYVPPRAV